MTDCKGPVLCPVCNRRVIQGKVIKLKNDVKICLSCFEMITASPQFVDVKTSSQGIKALIWHS